MLSLIYTVSYLHLGAPDCLDSLVLPLVLSVVGNPALVGHAEKPVRKATYKLAKELLKGLTSFYPKGATIQYIALSMHRLTRLIDHCLTCVITKTQIINTVLISCFQQAYDRCFPRPVVVAARGGGSSWAPPTAWKTARTAGAYHQQCLFFYIILQYVSYPHIRSHTLTTPPPSPRLPLLLSSLTSARSPTRYTPTPSALTAGAKVLRATVLQPMQALVSLLTALSAPDRWSLMVTYHSHTPTRTPTPTPSKPFNTLYSPCRYIHR